jgi:hypothetical protein
MEIKSILARIVGAVDSACTKNKSTNARNAVVAVFVSMASRRGGVRIAVVLEFASTGIGRKGAKTVNVKGV